MAQGLEIKVLALTHKMTSQEKFMGAALMALKALLFPFVYDDHVYRSKSCSARAGTWKPRKMFKNWLRTA
jgi:hypothetical protein